MSQPISGTIAEAYLRDRGITALHGTGALRFHPALLLSARRLLADRDLAGDDRRRHRSRRPASPARIAPGSTRRGRGKAPVDTPQTGDGPSPRQRRPLRCGARRVWRPAKASRPCCRSAASCPTCRWRPRCRPRISPPSCFHRSLRRLYIARDDDPAGDGAMATLVDRATAGRDRGDLPVADSSETSTRICAHSASMRFGRP